MQESQPSQELNQNKSTKHSKLSLVASVALVILVFTVSVWAGFKWRSQISEYKLNISQRDQQIAELEKQVQSLKKDENQQTTNTQKDQYLVIKEWGVKIKLNEDIQDIFYVLNGNQASFSTEHFSTVDKYCDPRQKDGESFNAGVVGALVKGQKTDKVGGLTAAEWDPSGKIINGNYYYHISSQSPCTETETSQELKFSQGFNRALETLQAQ